MHVLVNHSSTLIVGTGKGVAIFPSLTQGKQCPQILRLFWKVTSKLMAGLPRREQASSWRAREGCWRKHITPRRALGEIKAPCGFLTRSWCHEGNVNQHNINSWEAAQRLCSTHASGHLCPPHSHCVGNDRLKMGHGSVSGCKC